MRSVAASLCLLISTLPVVSASGPARIPRTDRTVSVLLQNGITVTVAPIPGSGIVAARGRLEAGSIYDGDRPGLSALATSLLALPILGETPHRPALYWTPDREPTAFVNFRWIEFEATCLPAALPSLLRVIAGRLGRAAGNGRQSVPDVQLERLRTEATDRSRRLESSDAAAFWRRGLARLYPAGSALASPPWGAPATLAGARVGDVLRFLRARAVPERTTVVVTGEVEMTRCLTLLRESLGRVGPGQRAGRRPRIARARGPRVWTQVVVPRPPRGEDTVVVMWPGDRSRPWDYVATRALVFLLGDSTGTGRLGREVVAPGLASSAFASLEEEGAPGFLLVRATAARGGGRTAAARIREVVEDAARGAFTASDLEAWKTSVKIAAYRDEQNPRALARLLFNALARAPQPPAAELTLEHLNATARRLFALGAPVAFVTASEADAPPGSSGSEADRAGEPHAVPDGEGLQSHPGEPAVRDGHEGALQRPDAGRSQADGFDRRLEIARSSAPTTTSIRRGGHADAVPARATGSQ